MLIYDKDERWTAAQLLKHAFFKELRDFEQQQNINQFPVGPSGFAKSISSNIADNLSQYSRRNSDNASDADVTSGLGVNPAAIAMNSSTYVTQKHGLNKQ
jgi:serine/threonine protein kinase